MVLAVDIGESFNRFFDNLFEWLPRVVGFLVVLIIAYIVAKLVGKLVGKLLQKVGFDRIVERGIGGSMVSKVIRSPSKLLGTVVFWIILIAGISIAVDILGIAALEDAIRAVWGYVPNVLAALAIFLIAGALAAGVAGLVSRTMGDTTTGKVVGAIAPTLIMAIAVFMMLDQLEIAPDIVVITYAALLGAVALGMAIAFGLGGREVAGQMLQGAYQKGQESKDQVKQDVQQGKERAKQEAERARAKAEASGEQRPGATDDPELPGSTRAR